MPDIPRFRIPFEVTDGKARTVEQDSDRDVQQCVQAITSTETGSLTDLPEFGISDQAHRKGGADLAEIGDALSRWEPRVDAETDQELENLIANVRVMV